MGYVILLLLFIGVIWLVSAPLRRGATASQDLQDADLGSMRRVDLEAARDSKYREIRDAELDHETGKLSDADFDAIDSTLRSEAIGLLHELDDIEETDRQQAASGGPGAD